MQRATAAEDLYCVMRDLGLTAEDIDEAGARLEKRCWAEFDAYMGVVPMGPSRSEA
jgi:hypothetical protein